MRGVEREWLGIRMNRTLFMTAVEVVETSNRRRIILGGRERLFSLGKCVSLRPGNKDYTLAGLRLKPGGKSNSGGIRCC